MTQAIRASACLTMLALVAAGCSGKPSTVQRNDSVTPAATNTTIRTNDNLNPISTPSEPSSRPNARSQQTLAPGQTPRSNSATAVGRREAINVFKVRPLYEATTLGKTMNATWYTSAKKYPETGSYMYIFYSPADRPRPQSASDGYGHLSEGFVVLEQKLLGIEDVQPCTYKPVKTRDHDACAFEARKNPTPEQRSDGVYGGNVTERTLHWFQKVDKGYLFVRLLVDPDLYSLEQLVALTDDLTVIR